MSQVLSSSTVPKLDTGEESAGGPPPPPPPGPPPPPPPSNLPVISNKQADLMSSIRNGAKLKKTAGPPTTEQKAVEQAKSLYLNFCFLTFF
jgi:hypothetical protein